MATTFLSSLKSAVSVRFFLSISLTFIGSIKFHFCDAREFLTLPKQGYVAREV